VLEELMYCYFRRFFRGCHHNAAMELFEEPEKRQFPASEYSQEYQNIPVGAKPGFVV